MAATGELLASHGRRQPCVVGEWALSVRHAMRSPLRAPMRSPSALLTHAVIWQRPVHVVEAGCRFDQWCMSIVGMALRFATPMPPPALCVRLVGALVVGHRIRDGASLGGRACNRRWAGSRAEALSARLRPRGLSIVPASIWPACCKLAWAWLFNKLCSLGGQAQGLSADRSHMGPRQVASTVRGHRPPSAPPAPCRAPPCSASVFGRTAPVASVARLLGAAVAALAVQWGRGAPTPPRRCR